MRFEFGDIVLVPFPFTDQTATKQRPAVIVSGQTYNQSRPDVVVMAITSQLRPAAGFAETTVSHWEAAGLLKPSVVKPVLATLEQRLVIKVLGRLQASDQHALRQAIAQIVGELGR